MERFLYKRLESKSPKINVWWAYGAQESFAMASLGYLSIFKDLDLNPDLYTERIYSDTKIISINPKDVDCMGFSTCFELDILTIIKMLKKYNFPLKACERGQDDPIIFAGGIVMMTNPIPYIDFFDFVVISEKAVLKDVFKVLVQKRELGRDEILEKLSQIEGIYVPSHHKGGKIKIIRDDIKNSIVTTPILSDKSFFSDTFVLELERGCPKMCKFCLASWINYPVRYVDFDEIIKAIDFGLQYTNKIALLGAYVAGHPRFSDIIKYIQSKIKQQNKPIELSISSLRADLADDELIKTLVQCSQKTATIALEAGSEELRNKINKNLTDEQFLSTLNSMQKNGLKGAKIYVMVGLPEEKEEDIEAFVELAKKIKAQIKVNKTPFSITISASTFAPKPHTPFKNAIRPDKKTLEGRIKYLKKEFHKLGIDFRPPSIEWDMVQSILSRYNEPLGDLLIETTDRGANLGAFKQVWREYNKKGALASFDECAKTPLNNIKTLNFHWDSIDCAF